MPNQNKTLLEQIEELLNSNRKVGELERVIQVMKLIAAEVDKKESKKPQ